MEKDEGRPILGSCADSAMPFSVGFRVEGSSGFRVAFGVRRWRGMGFLSVIIRIVHVARHDGEGGAGPCSGTGRVTAQVVPPVVPT